MVGDGITNQVSNPDVDVDVRKTNPIINQQILQLKMITEKLKKAFNGLDVDYSDISGKQSVSLMIGIVIRLVNSCAFDGDIWETLLNNLRKQSESSFTKNSS